MCYLIYHVSTESFIVRSLQFLLGKILTIEVEEIKLDFN